MRVERSATIDQPVDRVFDYVSIPENDPTWVPASLRYEMLSPAPMRVGSITEEDVWFLGRRMRYAWEITQYDPPTAFALRSISGPIPATIRVLLESLDGARTKVILVGEVRLRGVYKPMELVMRGGPTAVRDPAAQTKESAGERSLPISLTLGSSLRRALAPNRQTSATSISGSLPSVAEKRTFGELSVRTVHRRAYQHEASCVGRG